MKLRNQYISYRERASEQGHEQNGIPCAKIYVSEKCIVPG